MTCRTLSPEDLVAWTDGELAPADARRVEAHVASCAACAREADLLRRTGELVGKLPRVQPSEGFADRVAAAARAESRLEAARAGRPARVRFLRWAAASAAVVVAGVGVAWLATRGNDPARLSAREEEDIARDLLVLAHLSTLESGEADDLASLADDLDVIEQAAETLPEDRGG
jgi:anti-sigma factor RsiW